MLLFQGVVEGRFWIGEHHNNLKFGPTCELSQKRKSDLQYNKIDSTKHNIT